MNLNPLITYLQDYLKGEIKLNEPMKHHTSWKIGGPADIMVFPGDSEDIKRTITGCRRYQIPWSIVGSGSNLLVLDGGIRGVVIKIEGCLSGMKWQSQGVEVEAGVLLPRLAKEAAKRGLSGLEWSAGIPASVGGAVIMNAGIGEYSFGDYVKKVEVIDEKGRTCHLGVQEMSFSYRYSILHGKNVVVTKVILALSPGEPQACEKKIREYLEKRRSTQPVDYPTAGSVFKNPAHGYAGQLIEAVGGKGLRCGMAEVSTKHANFIVNLGDALAKDVVSLIEEIKMRVRQEFNIDLETEVHIVGEAR